MREAENGGAAGQRPRRPLIWAHRGASGTAPENTMAAFELACKQGADGIELDVQLSRDGEPVVIHDERVDRTSDGRGYVRELSLAQLRAFEYRAARPDFMPGSHIGIPLLEEVLALLQRFPLSLNIELKNSIVPYEGMEEKVLKLVRAYHMEERVLYSSFNHYSLLKMRQLVPDAPLGMLYSDGWVGAVDYAAHLGVQALHPALYHLQETGLVRMAHETGMRVHVWTVNEPGHMRACAEVGVDAIITNEPALCREVLNEQLESMARLP